ncbi:MAG: protein kinase, partial [Gemmatimonadetes bacterium]|nr:protein kinase [Gemmatimonadota bacterium]
MPTRARTARAMNCYKCQTPLPDNSRFCLSCGADVSGETGEHTLAVDHADPELQKKLQDELGTDYILERELGRGGMAVVFLGHDAHLGRKVAVKVLPPELTFGGGGIIERFKREARTAATLDHPNIIPVYRVSTGGKLFWYVMKYLEGESLDHVLGREGQLPVDRSAHILTQVAEALGYAHKKQVVHRDVKPANVMLDAEDRVTVTDFGIAKALDANTLTASGSMIGTPYYMSPEQCSGKRVTGASDQYSLSVMAYQMLGGHVPFTGDSVVEIIKKHCMDPVPPLGVLRPNLPQPLIAVVERALAKSPEERFASVVDFTKAFAAAAQGLDVTLAPPVKVTPGRASRTAIVSPIPGALRTAKGRAGRWLWIAGGSGALAVAAAAVVVFWPRGNAAEQRSPLPGAPPSIGQPQQPLLALGADTARTAARETTVAAAPPPSTPASARLARLTLRDVPDGATVTRDGQRVRGNTVELTPGRRHTVAVAKPGFETWTENFTPREGQAITRVVVLRALAQAAAPPPQQPPAAPPQQAAPVQQAQPQLQPAAAQPVAAPAPPTTGYISLLTNPRSTIYVN